MMVGTPLGPATMSLGGYAFRALGFSFRDLGRDLQTPWAEVEVTMRFDSLQWVGPKSDAVTISGVLFPEEFGGLSNLEGIRRAAIAGRPLMLVTVDGNVKGRHVVMGVSEDQSFLTARALPRRNAYQIDLRRYTGVGGIASLF